MEKTAGQLLAEALKAGKSIDNADLEKKMAEAMQRDAAPGVKISNFKIS